MATKKSFTFRTPGISPKELPIKKGFNIDKLREEYSLKNFIVTVNGTIVDGNYVPQKGDIITASINTEKS